MIRRCALVVSIVAMSLLPSAASSKPGSKGPHGPLVIAGGEFSPSNPGWRRFADLAGGSGAPVIVIPTASGDPARNGARAAAQLARLGLNPTVVPLIADAGNRDRDGVAENQDWAAAARAARGFWFIGGDQGRITGALLRPDGSDTALAAAIRTAHAGGAVVGGSSAGAAIMSSVMFKEGPEPLEALQAPLVAGRHTDRGLGFIGDGWFVDQHFVARGRFARTLVAMRDNGFHHGVGIEEDSAIVIADGRTAEVVGSRGVVLVDLSAAASPPGAPVSLVGASLSFLGPGDRFDLFSRQVTPAPSKAQGTIVEPSAPGFAPYYGGGDIWFPDMLGPQIIYEAMIRVLDGKAGRVRGIAFGRPGGSDIGFEFQLERGPGTRGWFTSDPAAYTVLDVRLSVRPVRMATPLYEPLER